MPPENIHSSVGRTGGKRRNHHCNECKKAFTPHCVNKGHRLLCEVESCRHLFAPRHGCTKHRYRDGYNVAVHDVYKNRDPEAMAQKRAARDRQLQNERHERISKLGANVRHTDTEEVPYCRTPARTENDVFIDET